MNTAMNYWLVKQEPEAYSWASFVKDGRTAWTGVRNFQARNNPRAMKKGDLVAFYHSVSEKQVVGVARVDRPAYPDPTAKEGDWSCVDLVVGQTFVQPVTLDTIKSDPILSRMRWLRQSRLSVTSVAEQEFQRLLELGGVAMAKDRSRK